MIPTSDVDKMLGREWNLQQIILRCR